MSKPLSFKPVHVKANTVIGKEKFSKFSSFYAKRFYNKQISAAYFLKLVTFFWVKEMRHTSERHLIEFLSQ